LWKAYLPASVPGPKFGSFAPAAGVPAGHCAPSAVGTHTGVPQHVLMAHTLFAGHEKPGLAPHGPVTLHEVLPGTQKPPPEDSATQTQSVFELLHGMNVAQLAPTHSGCDACAASGATDARTIGATYAAVPALRTRLRDSRRLSRSRTVSLGISEFAICPPESVQKGEEARQLSDGGW
jgi:hypothetical protein